jgi:hypothetical protein
MRSLGELTSTDEPAWPVIEALARDGAHPMVVLPADRDSREGTLVRLQVTTRSDLGALALETGGLLIDHGWLRMLGGGPPPLNLAIANGLDVPPDEPPASLLVAFDILGGKYAINGGPLPGSPGEVCYFAPDELAWWPMEMGHHDFVAWCFTDRLAQFNEHLRWDGWETEVAALRLDEGIAVYPFPFTAEGQDLGQVTRRPAPISELLTIWEQLAAQVGGLADGQRIRFEVGD